MIQCVPNFSEGRDRTVIDAIVDAIRATSGARVVDVSSDGDHHRTVVTFIGQREPVVAAAVAAAAVAVARIDLRQHEGQHPRLGAVDVVPFVPLQATSMEECLQAAHEAGRRMAEELGLPVYFYERAAARPERANLPAIRQGGFNALRDRDLRGELEPDLGPGRLHPTAGAVIVGARRPLIAFNVILQTDRLAIAQQIARGIRERDGGLVGVRALGLELPSRALTQVSVNMTEPDRVPMHRVLEMVRRDAARHGVAVAGTELIGTCRLEDLLEVGRYYMGMHDLSATQILDLALAPSEEMEGKDPSGWA